jgi:tRNA-2-methylthio-N6-dimethylallyladenosine synthase
MNRGYTAAEYAQRVARVREAAPQVAIASDFIVGFPGETGEDFEATADLARRMRFASGFVFKYSPRPGTLAARKYPDDVPRKEKERRHRQLLDLISEIASEENQAFVGRWVEVLVEGPAPRPWLNARAGQTCRPNGAVALPANPPGFVPVPINREDYAGAGQSAIPGRRGDRNLPAIARRATAGPQWRGRTPCHRLVVFDGPPNLAGEEVKVRIERAGPITLFASLCRTST